MADEIMTDYSEWRPWEKYYTKENLEAPVPECNLYEYLRDTNKPWPDIPAIIYYGTKINYRDLLQYIDEAAGAFAEAGVKEGDYVSLCTLTTPEMIIAFYALNKLGAACNIIEPRTNSARICKHNNQVGSRILLVTDAFVGKINEILPELNADRIIILPLGRSMSTATRIGFKLTKGRKLPKPAADARYTDWDKFIASGKGRQVGTVPYKKDRPAAIVYTGGTTGVPKGAILSNDSINALTIEVINAHFEYQPGDTFLNIMPPFIAYGVSCGLNMHLTSGITNILIPAFDPKDFTSYILKYRPNHIVGVPSHIEGMISDPKLKDYDFSFLNDTVTGGDSMSVGVAEKIDKFYAAHNCPHPVLRGYGMTELGSAACTTFNTINRVGSVGIPLPGTVLTVRDSETLRILGPNEKGELFWRSNTMMVGYFNAPEEDAKIFYTDEQGRRWVRSGDIGYMDEDGFIYIIGRRKRMIIRPDGHNVWPSQIEEVISRFPRVKEVAAAGLRNPSGEHGRIPTAFIVPIDKDQANEAFLSELRSFVAKYLPERDCPMAYRFLDALPLTSVGKVDFRALEEYSVNE